MTEAPRYPPYRGVMNLRTVNIRGADFGNASASIWLNVRQTFQVRRNSCPSSSSTHAESHFGGQKKEAGWVIWDPCVCVCAHTSAGVCARRAQVRTAIL